MVESTNMVVDNKIMIHIIVDYKENIILHITKMMDHSILLFTRSNGAFF